MRYGLREGFANRKKKQCHDCATRFQKRTPISIHENVEGYEEARKCAKRLGRFLKSLNINASSNQIAVLCSGIPRLQPEDSCPGTSPVRRSGPFKEGLIKSIQIYYGLLLLCLTSVSL